MDTWKYEYMIDCLDAKGNVIMTYTSIQADTEKDAIAVTKEFFRDDCPDYDLADVIIKSVIDLEALEKQAEIAEYQRIADTNPYIFWEG